MNAEATVEDLARPLVAGFGFVDVRFDEVNARLDRLERNHFADHEWRIQHIEDALAISKSR
jgi:L-ribulose-5-phosphate 3-epimerase UlaE